MDTEDLVFEGNGQKLTATRTAPADGSRPALLALHGLGETSSRHRIRYLLEELEPTGLGWLSFDFSGNGDSTGLLRESTLRGRLAETRAAAAHLDQDRAPVLIGTSMGAHLAATLVPQLRPRALVFFCPAAYPASAADSPFDGSSLARPGNYPDSPAYAGLAEFDGDLLIIGAAEDQVVARTVVEGYLDSAGRARSTEVLWLEGYDHFVHRRLPDEPADRERVVRTIARVLSAPLPIPSPRPATDPAIDPQRMS
ncbi:alpha/beta hydrolase [Streptomyces sp. NPDC093089]|uniref:alpha/beta hydrolase n=1 Tax=Streptomyces sp. NPDC093089 TaxID=3366024 RepID=UPI0038234A65